MPDYIAQLRQLLADCRLCPRRCGVDRTADELGACGIGQTAVVASAMAHFGEEPVLVGAGGSGAIFFAGCNLSCVSCQNHDISQSTEGSARSPEQIAQIAEQLVDSGCVNINFVSPTHVAHAVAEAISIIRARGLEVPTVYNCSGYESTEVLRLLTGLIDIYLPDFKYADKAAGRKYSTVEDYPTTAAAALKEMYRQVGALQLRPDAVACKGVLVRHLVLPHDIARSQEVIKLVAQAAPGAAVNVMGQYHPAYRASEFPELMECPSAGSVRALRDFARQCGLRTDGMN